MSEDEEKPELETPEVPDERPLTPEEAEKKRIRLESEIIREEWRERSGEHDDA